MLEILNCKTCNNKIIAQKNLTYFVNGMHFWGCRIGLSRENKILEAFVIFSWKVKDIRKTHEVVEKFKLCQQVETSVFVSPRTLVNVTFPFL